MSERRIVAFSLTGKWAQTNDGVTIPITNMFDECGEETTDPDQCARFVCGFDETKWFVVYVDAFEGVDAN